jgi:hypothetical protein
MLQLKFSLQCIVFLIELNAWEDKWDFLILFKFLQDLRKKKLAEKVSLVLKGNFKKKNDQICGQYTNTCKLRKNCDIVQDFKNHKS